MDELKSVLKRFVSESEVFLKYNKSLKNVKDIFLLNNSMNFGADEIYFLLDDLLLGNLKRSGFFLRTYNNEEIKEQLSTPGVIKKDLAIPYSDGEEHLRDDFNRIVKDYWFFKGEEFSATYGNNLKRSAFGVLEIAFYENMVMRLMKHYSEKNIGAYLGYRLTQEQLTTIITDFNDLLIGEEMLLENREKNIAETITLMTSLFQKQSDGKGDDIEVNEMVEFAVSILSSLEISKASFTYLQNVCPTDSKGRFTPTCFRANFIGMFENKIGDKTVASKVPKFYDYLLDIEGPKLTSFLQETEGFSRSCTVFKDGTDVPMTEVDLLFILGGLFSIEQTFSRFDRGHGDKANNNILDVSEVTSAYYQVFKGAVVSIAGGSTFAKAVFQYIIKFKKIPKKINVLGFSMRSKRYRASKADRSTLASVLKAISFESPELKTNPYPCETLR
jgi:hypothetical protein